MCTCDEWNLYVTGAELLYVSIDSKTFNAL